jgi:cytochrome c oxidase assembly protein subunit 15
MKRVSISPVFLKLIQILPFLVVGLMALGAGVRTMNAGLACPDWPLCFGKVIPDFHVGVYFEFIHRTYAGLVSILFLISFIYIQRNKTIPCSAKNLAWVALAVLLGQIVMGGLTVLKLLKFIIVTSHLALATLFFGSQLWMSFQLSPPPLPAHRKPPRAMKVYASALPFLIFAQLLLGGLVASTYAGLVCLDFPTCNGMWLPPLEGPIGLQVVHRFGAYLVFLFVTGFFICTRQARKLEWSTPNLQKWALIFFLVVCTQVALGISNLLLYIPPWMAVLHHLCGILLFGASLRCAFLVRYLALAAQQNPTAI